MLLGCIATDSDLKKKKNQQKQQQQQKQNVYLLYYHFLKGDFRRQWHIK